MKERIGADNSALNLKQVDHELDEDDSSNDIDED